MDTGMVIIYRHSPRVVISRRALCIHFPILIHQFTKIKLMVNLKMGLEI